MIRLHLLGAARLRDAGDVEYTAVLQQPKRLALLAYLSAAEPLRLHRRDSLLAMFWPESDDAHARAALRRALHFLRKQLGDDVIATRGDDVGVAPEALWCDVVTLREQLKAGRDRDALESYGGDLLEGFFVPTAPEFERWLDEERGQLQRMIAEAAVREAEAGPPASATRWARRAVDLAPDDETLLGRVLSLLDRSGDRTAALQMYDAFARRLLDDFGVEPSPETLTLVRSIRERRATHTDPAAPADPSGVPPSPNLVAVLPFAVRGDESADYLREGLVELLVTKLDGAGDLRTVDAHAVLTRIETDGGDVADPAVAARIARHFRAGAYVTGSVVADAGRLHLRAVLHELASGMDVRADSEGDGDAGAFNMVDAVVRSLLAGRSTSVGGHLGRVAAVTTGSLAALKRYVAGEQAFRAGRYADAIAEFEAAVAEDQAFALAWYRLAAARAARSLYDGARAASTHASNARGKLARHAAQLVEAQHAWLAGDIQRAGRAFTRVLDDRPEDVEAWYHLGVLRFAYNAFRGRRAQEARGALERTVDLDPKHVAALAILARVAAIGGRTDDVGHLVDRYLTRSPTGDQAVPLRALRAFAGGGSAERHDVVKSLGSTSPSAVAAGAAAMALSGSAAAGDALRELAGTASTDAARLLAYVMGAHAVSADGSVPDALVLLDAASTIDARESVIHRAWLLSVWCEDVPAADLERTRDLLESLAVSSVDSGDPGRPAAPHAGLYQHLYHYLGGLLAVRSGKLAEARELADRCENLVASPTLDLLPANLALGVRASVQFADGSVAEALETLQGIRLGPWAHFADRSPVFGMALERSLRAAALDVVGRRDDAAAWRGSLAERSPFELLLRRQTSAPPAASP